MNGRIGLRTADGAHPEPDEMYRAIGGLLRTVRTELLSSLDRELAEHRISGAQHAILATLAEGGIDSAAGLCRAMSYDPGAMTRMLDRLECKGFIRRVPCIYDRRSARLELTAEGRAAYPVQKEAGAKVLGRRLKSLTLAEARQLYELLTRLAEDREENRLPSPSTAPNPAA
jgi:DNA-binding MarR family transcriptional regulator